MFWTARLGLMLVAACGGNATPGGPNETTMVPDAGPAGPFDITIASSPPIELPGTVLWLDANFGVARDGARVRAWTDRSGLGHIFEAVGEADPTSDRLGGQAVLRFGGHARLALSKTVEDRARAALTLGTQDLLIAMVVSGDGGAPQDLFALAGPAAASPVALLQLEPTLSLQLAGEPPLATAATLEGPRPRLVVVLRQGGQVAVRVDGAQVASAGSAAGAPADLPFVVPYLGGWTLEMAGFEGVVGEVVMVAGPAVEADLSPLEAYLQQKYGL